MRLRPTGPVAWMARHGVAPNLLMLFFLLGGLYFSTLVRQELFPSYELDTVTIKVSLPGATPAEVEAGVILAVEERLAAVPGISKLTATAGEGWAEVQAELDSSRPRQLVFNDIRQEVDRITTFPDDAEEPTVRLDARRRSVLWVYVWGDTDPRSLRMAAESVRARLLEEPGITQVELARTADIEIAVEIPRATLRAYGLTLDDVAETVRRSALDRSGGALETEGGDILLRIADRRDLPAEYAEIPLIADPRGTVLRLGDVANVRYGFEDTDQDSTFNGKPAIRLIVRRVGEETPITVSDAVRAALPDALSTLPGAISATIVDDDSDLYRARMELLIKNGFMGLVLVLVLLSAFLEFRLAFWVAVGIPTAFLGTLIFLPWVGVSINMVSMFAFILALGIVVDDAIVVGENIYEYLQRGMSRLDAAIRGAQDIAVPLSFSIITNIIAFIPLAMVPGWFGKFWIVIPIVVAITFLLSWIEALFILPAHLAAVKRRDPNARPGLGRRIQQVLSGGLDRFVERIYGPLLRVSMSWRYTTVALMVLVLAITLAWPISGRMGYSLWPSVTRDTARATVNMPVDAPESAVHAVRDQLIAAAGRVIEANGGDRLATGISTEIDGTRIKVIVYLKSAETRPISTGEFTRLWRQERGAIPAARSVGFDSSWGGPGGRGGIALRLSHADVETLARASQDLIGELEAFGSVRDAEDDFNSGKVQLEYRLTEAGRAAGFTARDIAAQVRAAFLGVEALRQQEGRNELTVRVRLPEAERSSEFDIETLILRAPDGSEAPLYETASVERGRGENRIRREDGRRVITVRAKVVPSEESVQVLRAVEDEIVPRLLADYPGLGFSLSGRQQVQAETMASFHYSVLLTLIVIYAVLAIPFRSYIQPAIVMTAIPFGFAGAVIGHMIMGHSLSIISIFGVIALSGVVINAALVMLDLANRTRAAGVTSSEAIWIAGKRRFRPILLTTLTTFGGLAPMIFETSRQAQFLVPMAISLGYGIVFATVVVLFLIPSLYMILEDLRALVGRASIPGGEGDGDDRPGRPVAPAE